MPCLGYGQPGTGNTARSTKQKPSSMCCLNIVFHINPEPSLKSRRQNEKHLRHSPYLEVCTLTIIVTTIRYSYLWLVITLIEPSKYHSYGGSCWFGQLSRIPLDTVVFKRTSPFKIAPRTVLPMWYLHLEVTSTQLRNDQTQSEIMPTDQWNS